MERMELTPEFGNANSNPQLLSAGCLVISMHRFPNPNQMTIAWKSFRASSLFKLGYISCFYPYNQTPCIEIRFQAPRNKPLCYFFVRSTTVLKHKMFELCLKSSSLEFDRVYKRYTHIYNIKYIYYEDMYHEGFNETNLEL